MLTGPALRILDANANRAREALRVLEDYARFGLNDDRLTAALKDLRHGLTEAISGLLSSAILHRDTPGDVGTRNKTPAETRRAGLDAVVVAAGKRLAEALRVIEELLKISDPAQAASIETLRYRFYDLEQKIVRTIGRSARLGNVLLYVLITESACKRPWLQCAEQAILGGADCLQLREKQLDSRQLLNRARQLVELCRQHGVLSIVNDRPDVALLAGADGVHVGQTDLPAAETRRLIGPGMILGVSTHHIGQARQAVTDGADYIGAGPVFLSSTKPRDFIPGLDYLRQLAGTIPIPVLAIAGITQGNVDQVLDSGIRRVAVASAVTASEDPRAAAQAIKHKLLTWTQAPPWQSPAP